MEEVRQCKQCGVIRPLGDFRRYYGGRKGSYRTCRVCERINSRAKYLESKQDRSAEETAELDKIYKLWETQRSLGLQPPRTSSQDTRAISSLVDEMSKAYGKRLAHPVVKDAETPVPQELADWLTAELTQEPDYYLDTVYEDLRKRYKPMLYLDQATMLPEHDETYSEVLEKILARFYAYEDEYYDKEG